jgi:hypothetical protein
MDGGRTGGRRTRRVRHAVRGEPARLRLIVKHRTRPVRPATLRCWRPNRGMSIGLLSSQRLPARELRRDTPGHAEVDRASP